MLLLSLPLLCVALAAASPNIEASVSRHPAVPPAVRVRSFVERRQLEPTWPAPTPSPWFKCPTQFGLYPDPYDCSSYFQCSYGTPFEEHCQPGLQYNPMAMACDFPGNISPPCVPKPYPTDPPAAVDE
ncbi:uncharacterized protein LOC119104899 [Pollicipes pollicipes]|uniref:uncharacterized protein LOC119104899 n=1 Tax=Pollicipes pollicipes TaxID=41117 RepID=UPI001884EDD1|nr:uncharacterized protein LOC119104899 [Pollicipes pollicipes]